MVYEYSIQIYTLFACAHSPRKLSGFAYYLQYSHDICLPAGRQVD